MCKGSKPLPYRPTAPFPIGPNLLPEVIFIKKFFKFVFELIHNCKKDGVDAYSAQTAFFVTVSFIPFVMLLIGMIRFLPVEEVRAIEWLVSVFPKSAHRLVTSFVTESYEKSGSVLISVAAVATLWASSIGVYILMRGLNRILGDGERKGILKIRLMGMVYTFVLMILLVLCLTFFVFGDTIAKGISGWFPWIFKYAAPVKLIRAILGVLVLSLFFTVIYKTASPEKTKLVREIPGAVISALGWMAFSYAFSYYYENLSRYSYLYGSLSAMVFFMLWLFVCIYILFVGAEINKVLRTIRYEK